MINRQTLFICCGLLLAALGASAQQTQAADVDADVMAALDKMGAELRSHTFFTVKADVTNEDVLGDGQKLQFAGTLEVQARRPDRFKITAVSDLRDRRIYYDGKQVTVFSPRLNYFASFDAPSTIADTVKLARDNYDVELPLADLFTWGTEASHKADVTSAFLVRSETIDGHKCNHYALRQKEIDWQIWIAQEGAALPCKIVITKTTDPSMPQYSAVLRWSFPSSIGEDVFAFSPPSSAKKIVFAKSSN